MMATPLILKKLSSFSQAMEQEEREMSKVIDIDAYDAAEETHPFYLEMVAEMLEQIKKKTQGKQANILEMGSGTGLFTKRLLEMPNLKIDGLEIDKECFGHLKRKFGDKKINLIQGNAVTYCKEGYYDIVVSCFAHDHTSNFENRLQWAKNMAKNLKPGGVYIVGQEIIPKFSNKEERKKALRAWQGYVVWQAIQDGHEEVAGLEFTSLKAALAEIGDWKRHMEMFKEEMRAANLKQIFEKKIGPLDRDDVGGVYVHVYQK